MSPKRIFGHIAGIPVGTWFPDRQRLHEAGVHRPLQAGISGSQTEGADSIVISGGYEDDVDYGNRLIYTGAGGNDPAAGEQIANQVLTKPSDSLGYLRFSAVVTTCVNHQPSNCSQIAHHR